MKKIIISGREFFYEIFADYDEFRGITYETEFYDQLGTKMEKKYNFFGHKFGPIVEVEDNSWVFSVNFNIEDETITKSELRSILERHVELLFRKSEIESGQLI